jgi:hypothetical protein
LLLTYARLCVIRPACPAGQGLSHVDAGGFFFFSFFLLLG